jgi:hypothetical protein
MSEKKARQELNALVKNKILSLQKSILKNLSEKKKAQARSFIHSYYEAKFAEMGKIKLRTLDSLLRELK